MVRFKMIVTERKNMFNQWGGARPTTAVILSAVAGEENKTWAKYTPSGKIELSIDNPDAYAYFELGKTYFVDFTEAPAKEADENQS
jgi:hypothetical protein